MDLALAMLDEKDSGRCFHTEIGHLGVIIQAGVIIVVTSPPPLGGHSRSLSWSVSRSWSAAKQLQSIANNLIPPRGNEIAATSGLAVPIFSMSSVLMFVLWVLVAAIPCQDRGLNTHFSIPRQFSWGTPLHSLHERILEVSRRREHRNSNGLLNEICQVERCARRMTDLVDTVQFPLTKEHEMEVEQGVQHYELQN